MPEDLVTSVFKMALQRLCSIHVNNSKTLIIPVAKKVISDIPVLNIRQSATCCRHTLIVKNRSNTVTSHQGYDRGNHLQYRPFQISSVCYKSGFNADRREGKKDHIFPSNEDMNLRHSVENDYLSWMRNTYMMTLAGLTILNTSSVTDNTIISRVVFLTAFLNLSAGTLGYLYSLSSLRQRKVMRGGSSFSCQIAAVLHMCLWLSVLILITSSDSEEEAREKETRN